MQEIVLHLGLHKTGTTFLQDCIFPNLKDVEVQRLSEISKVKFISNKNILLISNEDLIPSMPHYENNDEAFNVFTTLNILFPHAKIILGVRNSDSWFKSCWNHYIRTSGTMSYKEYLMGYGGNVMHPVDYIAAIKKLWTNVFIYRQENLKENPKQEIEKMCRFIGVPVPPFETTIVRKGLSSNKVRLLRLINCCTFGLYNKIFHIYADVYTKIAYYKQN